MSGDSGRKSPSIVDDWTDVDGDTASIKSTPSIDDDEFYLLPEFNKPPETSATSSTANADVKNKRPADSFEKQPLYAVSWRNKQQQPEAKPEPEPERIPELDSKPVVACRKAKNIDEKPKELVTAPIPIESAKKKSKEPVTAPIPIEQTKKQSKEPVTATMPMESSQKQPEEDIWNAPEQKPEDSADLGGYVSEKDANYFYQYLVELHSQMGTAIKDAEAVKLSNHPTVLITRATCREVHNLLGELKLIHAAYAGAWLTDSAKIPLSPDLLSWMQNVKTVVDDATSVLAKIGRPQFGYAPPSSHGISDESSPHLFDLAECCENLDSARATLENFFPIIKADFDEFKTSSMSFPRYRAAPAGDTRRERPADPPHPAISRIRRQLYDLKDELQISLVFLTRLQHEVPAGTLPDAPNAVRSLRDLVVAISTLVTNDSSDWLNRDIGQCTVPTITYHNFVNLDADILHDVKQHVEEFNTQLDVSSEPLFQKYSATMIQNHQITSLNEGGQMYNLLSIISLLESVLMTEGAMF